MLVLTRKTGECIVVGDRITVVILEVDGGRARIGIEAPADVPIWRAELCRAAEKGGGYRIPNRGAPG
jgi:carbon storage regulator